MNKTCSACRTRKVRCDGLTPTCSPCSKARRPTQCEYTSASSASQAPKGPLLSKGAACFPCRRKKKKCDALRPACSTCRVAGKDDECEYDDTINRDQLKELQLHNQYLQDRVAAMEEAMAATASASREQPVNVSTYLEEQLLYAVNGVQEQAPFMFPQFDMGNFAATPPPMATSPITPYPVQIPLHTAAPQPLQIQISSPVMDIHHLSTPTTIQDLDLYRRTFIEHHGQLGLSLPASKIHAIYDGDISGRVVAPVLVYLAQLTGCCLWRKQNRAEAYLSTESLQLAYVFQTLDSTEDLVVRLQVHTVLTFYFLVQLQMNEGGQQLTAAADLAMAAKMQFPPHGSSQSDLEERIGSLSQLVYLNKAAQIILGATTMLTPEFDHQYDQLIKSYPAIAKNNFAVLRAKSMTLLYNARQLSGSLRTTGMDWSGDSTEGYWDMITSADQHMCTLKPLMLRATYEKTSSSLMRRSGLNLKLCMIISMTAAAELHSILMDTHLESRQSCLDMVYSIVRLTSSLRDEDYIFLDPILGTCWTMVIRVLHHERTTPLQICPPSDWDSAMTVVVSSANKLGHELPFMDSSIETMRGVVSETTPSP
ncbi:hypothetical protein CERSUDRAFT_113707 [Gelatoporia subvermispora B]|uniref:Zn(2)-C6 fungal-type domain-containing protein n=1 Tax=Ceriporiopsis subvermispora (strain B) TaxID=914234 RepID=M2RJ94_CERS8|nr:hypothetical protein CERSUDRAFT_113707 [Gelatoporia subvermispora B]